MPVQLPWPWRSQRKPRQSEDIIPVPSDWKITLWSYQKQGVIKPLNSSPEPIMMSLALFPIAPSLSFYIVFCVFVIRLFPSEHRNMTSPPHPSWPHFSRPSTVSKKAVVEAKVSPAACASLAKSCARPWTRAAIFFKPSLRWYTAYLGMWWYTSYVGGDEMGDKDDMDDWRTMDNGTG